MGRSGAGQNLIFEKFQWGRARFWLVFGLDKKEMTVYFYSFCYALALNPTSKTIPKGFFYEHTSPDSI